MTEDLPVAADAPRENFVMVILVGIAAALVGAALWALVTIVTSYQLGLMAIAVGFIVGIAIRKVRKQPDPIFGIIGAVLALLGCVLGNAASLLAIVADQEKLPLMQVVQHANPDMMVRLMSAGFAPMDLVFYAIAVYEGYKFSSR